MKESLILFLDYSRHVLVPSGDMVFVELRRVDQGCHNILNLLTSVLDIFLFLALLDSDHQLIENVLRFLLFLVVGTLAHNRAESGSST
jgi:hypothetical protein